MIDIVQNTSGSRKQIQQIGTPGQEERLYVEEYIVVFETEGKTREACMC